MTTHEAETSAPDGTAARGTVRTRFDLPGRPLTLADARLAVANAMLAESLGGELVLVRHDDGGQVAQEQVSLLRWLGLAWVDVWLEDTWPPEPLGDGQPSDTGGWRRVWEDHHLGVTHALVCGQVDELAAVGGRTVETLGWRPASYLEFGRTEGSRELPFSLAWYRSRGYLPEALRAALAASACWATPPAEPSRDEVVARYRSGRLLKGPWRPDREWLASAGRRAMRLADPGRIPGLLRPRLTEAYGRWHRAEGTAHSSAGWLAILAGAAQQECACLDDAVHLSGFAFEDRVHTITSEARAALEGPDALAVLQVCLARLCPEALNTPERAAAFFQELRHHFRDMSGLRGRQVMFPIRAALTGTMMGPCLGIVASLLGAGRCRDRLCAAIEMREEREGSRLG